MAEATTAMGRRGALVRFRAADVLIPPVDEILVRLHGDEVLEGRVIQEIQGDGASTGHVAVVVPRIADPVLVLCAKLLPEKS